MNLIARVNGGDEEVQRTPPGHKHKYIPAKPFISVMVVVVVVSCCLYYFMRRYSHVFVCVCGISFLFCVSRRIVAPIRPLR